MPEQVDFDHIRTAFEQAHKINPSDVQVLVALGVLAFIQREQEVAAQYFEMAIKENPTDYSLWNKLGAALASNMQTQEAINVYKQALEIRPNHVRTIANIGLGLNSIGEFA